MRRSLGFKLEAVASALLKFVQFMEDRHASHITIQLSLNGHNNRRQLSQHVGQDG